MGNRTIVVSGGGQGIGQAIALRFAREGWNVVVISKDRPELMQETVEGIEQAGGQALACDVDVRDVGTLQECVARIVARFGRIDVLVNNTSAPCFNDAMQTSPEQFDLVMSTSVRAAFFLSQLCYEFLQRSNNPHIINVAPPLNLEEQWLKDHLPFSVGKLGMSLCTRGMAAQFFEAKIAVNSLWPQTNIATQRLKDYLLPQVFAGSRWPSIMATAALELSQLTVQEATGQFFIDEDFLRSRGVTDFSHYAVDPSAPLVQTLFLPLKEGMVPISPHLFRK